LGRTRQPWIILHFFLANSTGLKISKKKKIDKETKKTQFSSGGMDRENIKLRIN